MRIFNTKAELMSMLATLDLQEEAAAYVKSYHKYVVGYQIGAIQIIKGTKVYSGLRDVGGYLHGFKSSDISANIDTHYPADIGGYLKSFYRDPEDLPGNIYAWQYKDLSAFLNTMRKEDLQVIISPIPPANLPAYLKVWPQEDLPVYLRGWQSYDLAASLNPMIYKDLPVYIGTHLWVNLKAVIKGWGREVPKDLPASIIGFSYNDLLVILRATYFDSINSYIYPVQPVDLQSSILGWGFKDLNVILDGKEYIYRLTASITAVGGYKDLNEFIRGVTKAGDYINLPSIIRTFHASDISSVIGCIVAPDLSAYINAIGGSSNLAASIYPKMIRLSTLLPVSTLEHKNLSAIINASCRWSMGVDLPGFIRAVHFKDISSRIKGLSVSDVASNLGASIGYHDKKIVVDKLPLSIILPNNIYKEKDKLPIYINVYNGLSSLIGLINGIYITKDLGSSITGTYLEDYSFKYSKNWDRVYDLEYDGDVRGKEDVEISFRSVVEDYFYVNAENKVYKIDELDRWVANIRSYTNMVNRIKVKRRLHRSRLLYDIQKFNSIDAAVRFMIDYVTDIPYSDLSSYIYTSSKCVDLGCSIIPSYIKHSKSILNSSITCVNPLDTIDVIYTTDTKLDIL